ncbi:Uncharacterised protein [Paenibacillus thiaminolyticus]|nr:Uncharacterised protein [Paenibacillus thiaminolyticus]
MNSRVCKRNALHVKGTSGRWFLIMHLRVREGVMREWLARRARASTWAGAMRVGRAVMRVGGGIRVGGDMRGGGGHARGARASAWAGAMRVGRAVMRVGGGHVHKANGMRVGQRRSAKPAKMALLFHNSVEERLSCNTNYSAIV